MVTRYALVNNATGKVSDGIILADGSGWPTPTGYSLIASADAGKGWSYSGGVFSRDAVIFQDSDSPLEQSLSTTDATATAITAQTIPLSSSLLIEATIIGKRTGGSAGSAGDSATFIMNASYKNIAGTVTQIGKSDIFSASDQAAWKYTLTISGTDVMIQVTGAANNNISWNIIYTTKTI